MNKIWYLSTCDTNKRIIGELELKEKKFDFQDIKEKNITFLELETIKNSLNCSYEDLFNKRALKYKVLKDKLNSDDDFKQAILDEYTFFKRPFIKINNQYFIGNAKKTIEQVKEVLKNES